MEVYCAMTVPCCQYCMKSVKPGQQVVWSRSLGLILHEACNPYHDAIIDDCGEYEEVIKRNSVFGERELVSVN